MDQLGYEFKDESLLKISLTHPSFSKKNNYERLEFLGDRVLGLIISDEIFHSYPDDSEGNLAKKISFLVCKNTLIKIADELRLEKHFIISKNIKENSFDSIKANSLEAVIAAIYLDSNFSNTYKIVKKLWNNCIQKINLDYHDPKSKLQEWSLKTNNILPVYEVKKKEGPDHNPIFTVNLKLNGKIYSIGVGKNKQDAEVMAAEKALKEIDK
ncbi:MAG: ribonuclease III [Alphaproteobacteria bacterium]|tara:strand:- start:301 stop:936 length:636 start_codon:yes stop_codon:yes gene_type:complete